MPTNDQPDPAKKRRKRKPKGFDALMQEMAQKAMKNALSEDNGPFLTPSGKLGGPFSSDYEKVAMSPPGTEWKRPQDPPGVTRIRDNTPLAADNPGLYTGWIKVENDSIIRAGEGVGNDTLSEADRRRIDAIIKEASEAAVDAVRATQQEATKAPGVNPSKYGRMIILEDKTAEEDKAPEQAPEK